MMQKKFIFWDPSPELFSFPIPILDRPILWYGFFFALGFLIAYWLFSFSLKKYLASHQIDPKEARALLEKTGLYILLGAVIGARLGDLLFYQDWAQNLKHPLAMIKFWEGGLASHGGAAGIAIALCILWKKMAPKFPSLTWRALLDLIVVPTCFTAGMIRLGNFMNQEILGTPTELPWAVIFGHPMDGSFPLPRHPVQLYEAFFYFTLFATLAFVSRKVKRAGLVSGLFFTSLFTFRFFIEFFKAHQSALLSSQALLDMGQILSLPFIAFGFYLLWNRERRQVVF